jgi:transcriptional regulator with XRE-family HTH domain
MADKELRYQPFPQALGAILEERGLSQRQLAGLTEKHGDSLSNYSISRLLVGELAPTLRSITTISKALNLDPRNFSDYRMLELRESLNPARTSYRKALATLKRLESQRS